MSPLAPPDPSAPPWRFCRACGSPYLEGRDTLCKRCKNPVGERGLILNAGGGHVPVAPQLIYTAADAVANSNTIVLTGFPPTQPGDYLIGFVPAFVGLVYTIEVSPTTGILTNFRGGADDGLYSLDRWEFYDPVGRASPSIVFTAFPVVGPEPFAAAAFMLIRGLRPLAGGVGPEDGAAAAFGTSTTASVTAPTNSWPLDLAIGCALIEGPPSDNTGAWADPLVRLARVGVPGTPPNCVTLDLASANLSTARALTAQLSGLTSSSWLIWNVSERGAP